MRSTLAEEFLNEACGGDGLQLALALEAPLPGRLVVDEQQRPYGVRREDLRGGHPSDPPVGGVDSRGYMQLRFKQLPERPATRDGCTRPVFRAASVMGDAELGAEQIAGLIVPVGLDHFL